MGNLVFQAIYISLLHELIYPLKHPNSLKQKPSPSHEA